MLYHIRMLMDNLLTTKEAAAILNIARSTFWTFMERGDIAYVRFGRCLRIERSALERFIRHHRTTDRATE